MDALTEQTHVGSARLPESALRVWRADLRRPPEWVDRAASSILEPSEAARRRSETDEAWRRRVVARAALRIALGRRLGRPPRSLRFATEANGKPVLVAEGPRPHFNLSHSGEICVIAISEAAAVGVDVEEVRNRPRLERIVRTRFAPGETQILALEGEERRRAFYRVWTRKEAVLKAAGAGLATSLRRFEVSATDRPELLTPPPGRREGWALIDLDLGGGLAGAVALGAPLRAPPRIFSPPELPTGGAGATAIA